MVRRPERGIVAGGALPVRSPGEWVGRGLLTLLIVLVGYFLVSFSLAQSLRRDVERAYAIAPYDGRNAARLATALSDADATPADRDRAFAVGRAALRRDPVSPAAASAIGITAQTRGDLPMARRAFAYAARLSRRDLAAQLWAIEDAVARGNVHDAILHYDVALRVKPELWELLFPVLAAASSQAPIRTELVRKLATRPTWADGFLNYAAGNSVDPPATKLLFEQLARARVVIPKSAEASLINALYSRGFVDQAWTYYASIRPGASRDRSRDPAFVASGGAPTRFDWVASADEGMVTTIDDHVFSFSAPASVGGVMLQQVQLLPPGEYRLVGRSAELDQPAGALPYWALTCADGRELGRVEVPASAQGGGVFSGTLRVPSTCPRQTLTLVARPSDAVGGLAGQITRVELRPIR